MSRGYVDFGNGQLHYYRWHTGETRILICLPPVPYGGAYYSTLAEHLPGVDIIAIDPPGFGASDPAWDSLSVEFQAEAVLTLVASLELDRVEVLGFHSGALVSLEFAASHPGTVDQLFMIDVPAFEQDVRQDMLAKTSELRDFSTDLSAVEPLWQFNVARHGDVLPRERGLSYLIQDLQAGVDQPKGFRAAFSFDVENAVARLGDIAVNLVATKSGLLDATRNLHWLLTQADTCDLKYQEWPDVDKLVFELNIDRVANLLKN